MRERTVERVRVLGRVARDAHACGLSRVGCIDQREMSLDGGGREGQRGSEARGGYVRAEREEARSREQCA
jgi:hypothetical protein